VAPCLLAAVPILETRPYTASCSSRRPSCFSDFLLPSIIRVQAGATPRPELAYKLPPIAHFPSLRNHSI